MGMVYPHILKRVRNYFDFQQNLELWLSVSLEIRVLKKFKCMLRDSRNWTIYIQNAWKQIISKMYYTVVIGLVKFK